MRRITKDENRDVIWIEEYDKYGNLIYIKNSNGEVLVWYETKYDDKEKIITVYSKQSAIKEYKYDENGKLFYTKDLETNEEVWLEYDDNGNEIHSKSSTGFEQWHAYDENNNLIYHKDSDGDEYKYDEKGNEIYYKDSNGFELFYEYED